MAEAMELNLTLPISEDNQVDNPILQKTKLNGKAQKLEKGNNKYTIEQYYKNDSLGSDVLKQKYLAPWEEHPYQLWERQAKALASVEKNDKLKREWEKEFYSILEDFKFVPGGRIMHGAGREDITTTLNNCYVVAIRKDSVKSIYDTIINEALTYKYGGGCGHDLSILRPSGKEINGTGGESCGPVGIMEIFHCVPK